MSQRAPSLIRVFLTSAGLALLFFILPSHEAFACSPLKITYPYDGQTFASSLPLRIRPVYNIPAYGPHYLDVYYGVPGKSQIVYGSFQGRDECGDGQLASNIDSFYQSGEYFYVLYNIKSFPSSSIYAWRDYWKTGANFSFPPPLYTVSHFYIASSRIPVLLVPGIGASMNLDVLLRDKPSDNWSFLGGEGPYGGLMDSLESLGYKRDKDLFPAFYDWRKSNDITASDNSVDGYLIPAIDRAKTLCQCSKVALVAHSMGGLLARSYIQSDKYLSRNDVSHLFLVGAPNKGSSDVYTLWEGGHIPKNWPKTERGGIFTYSWFMANNKLTGNTDRERYFTIRNHAPSVQQLLPVFDYLNLNDILLSFLGMQEQNPFLLSLNQHTDLLSSRVKLYAISGKDQPTVNEIPAVPRQESDIPLWVDGASKPLDPVPNDTNGDSRVLLSSSQIASALQNYVFSADHGQILVEAEASIAEKLGFSLHGDFPSARYANSLIYAVASPVDIEIRDPQGNILNKNINNIANSQYLAESDPGGAKLIIINDPIPGDYHLTLTPVGDGGEYHILAASFSDDTDIASAAQAGTIAPSQAIEYTSLFDPAAQSPIDLEPSDREPPVIVINSPEQKNYLRSETPRVDVAVTDEVSGVASSSIQLDGTIKENGATLDLFFMNLGLHTLVVDAVDNAGNTTQEAVSFQSIATRESTLSDINRAFQLGWIDNDGTRQSLTAKLPPGAVNFNAFLNELRAQRGKHIAESAYQILFEDIHWIQMH